jgi:Ran GTPase-activating protein (RanGAP) involved in mRNA processing and transport
MNDAELCTLDVSHNDIKDEGVAALACNLPTPTEGKGIRVLHLVQNAIGQEGAVSIAQALARLPLKVCGLRLP